MIDEACQQGLLDRPVMAAVDEKSLVRPDRLRVTGGLRRCQVIPIGWLWFSGTKTNSAAVIQYRFPDNLSAANVFFRIRPHILPIAIHYRLINAPFALVLP